jgi:catechol 2,3-dioxygenase-like lactoylglutathione lyase family enzyme
MIFEHFALNVSDARKVSQWYVDHLGLHVARARVDSPYTHFLADETDRIVAEFYTNPAAPVTDYSSAPPLCFHFAFVASDARAIRPTLEKAGATFVIEEILPDGSVLVMMRDPWGVPIQFCQRTKPFYGNK